MWQKICFERCGSGLFAASRPYVKYASDLHRYISVSRFFGLFVIVILFVPCWQSFPKEFSGTIKTTKHIVPLAKRMEKFASFICLVLPACSVSWMTRLILLDSSKRGSYIFGLSFFACICSTTSVAAYDKWVSDAWSLTPATIRQTILSAMALRLEQRGCLIWEWALLWNFNSLSAINAANYVRNKF